MSGYTPGPWIKRRGELIGSNGERVVEYGAGLAIMCGGSPLPEHEANARLIVSAPELLEIAQRILDRGYVSASIEEERGDHADLAAAVLKATGGQE